MSVTDDRQGCDQPLVPLTRCEISYRGYREESVGKHCADGECVVTRPTAKPKKDARMGQHPQECGYWDRRDPLATAILAFSTLSRETP